jgi:hypothetical protein
MVVPPINGQAPARGEKPHRLERFRELDYNIPVQARAPLTTDN